MACVKFLYIEEVQDLLSCCFTFQSRILADLTHVKMVANVIHLAKAFIVIANLTMVENFVKKVKIIPKLFHYKHLQFQALACPKCTMDP